MTNRDESPSNETLNARLKVVEEWQKSITQTIIRGALILATGSIGYAALAISGLPRP